MKAVDIEIGTDLIVTIKSWSMERIGRGSDDSDDPPKLALHFEEVDQALACGPTNAEIIAGFLGGELDDWVGHRIALYHNPNVKFGGKKVGGISVRESAPTGRGRAAAPAAAAAGGPVWTLEQALAAAEEVGVMKDDLRKILHDAGHAKGWKPSLTPWLKKILADMEPPPDDDADTNVEF